MIAAIAAAVYARRAAVATEETVAIARDAGEGASEALSIAERSASAAGEQTALARLSYTAQSRGWVKLTIDKIGPIYRTEGVFYVYVESELHNTGKSPVTDVAYVVMPFDLGDNSAEKTTRFVQRLTDMQGSPTGDLGLMPGESIRQAMYWCIHPHDVPPRESSVGMVYTFQLFIGCLYKTLNENGYVMKQFHLLNYGPNGFRADELDFDETIIRARLAASVIR